MNILITGASGFVGQQLCQQLINKYYLKAIVRTKGVSVAANELIVRTIDSHTKWQDIVSGVDVVIHLANRAHVMKEQEGNPYQAYKSINVDATLNLAQQAIDARVKRFIYLSSVKVNGEFTENRPFSESDQPAPEDDYGKTKYEAEEALKKICNESRMEFVIVRPPLVYGQGVKANFLNLINLCIKILPLPFGSINNKRSLIYIENLVSFIAHCINHPNAANNTFLVSDNDDQSTASIIRMIRIKLNKPVLLIAVPKCIVLLLLKAIGKKNLADRLLNNLQVDMSKAIQLLDWKPPFTFKQGIERTLKNFHN